jgi:glutamyl-Q tRNA(Asp) synthetase
VRVEDLDPPRTVPAAADDILRTLEAFGMHWDGEVIYQSNRADVYEHMLERLRRMDVVYPCACSRREIADSALPGSDGPVYPGTCRAGIGEGRTARAWRVRVDDAAIQFNDRVQGMMASRLATEVGDFVVRRADGLFAYQLAVVVDDAEQGITDVVRGADLLGSTARQIQLQRLLDLPTPEYLHLPVAVNARGEKLSKQVGAAAVNPARAISLLYDVLAFLGQAPPRELHHTDLGAVWGWAVANWDVGKVPKKTAIIAEV